MLPLPTIASRVMTTPGFTFARTSAKLEQLINDPQAPGEVVMAIISSDPLLTALVISQANQAGEGVTRLSEAMRTVGLGGVIGLMRGFITLPAEAHDPLAACWRQATACAYMTRLLARQVANHLPNTELDELDDETLTTAGLLHDIGSPLAFVRFPAEYARAIARLDAGEGPFERLLTLELGADASDLGYLLARSWNLPPLIGSCIRFHQRPGKADGHHDLVATVHIARLLVRACGFVAGRDRFINGVDGDALSRLHLRLDDFPPLLDRFFIEWEEREMFETGAS
jgi:HD-like signal output (HDOD) protein